MAPIVEWIESVAQMQALAQEWTSLEKRVQNRTVYSSFDYLASWYANYVGDYGGAAFIGVARNGNELVGLAPLVVHGGSMGHVPVTRVEFAAHDAQAGEFLVEDDQPEIIGLFLDSLVEKLKFDVIILNGLHAESDQFRILQDAAARHQLAVELTDHLYAVVDLRGGYDVYCNSMSRNFRRSLKRLDQKVTAAGRPKVDGIQLGVNSDKIEETVARLFAITEASYKLKGNRLAEHHRGFLGELAKRFAAREMLHLSILSIDNKDAAVVMGLVERSCYYDVTLAYNEAFAESSPGAYLMQEVLRNLGSAGIERVLSHGAHEYKKRWSTAFLPSTREFLFSPNFRGNASRFIRFSMGRLWRSMGLPEP